MGSVFLLFLPVFSPGFYVVYLLCGLSDMADGTIARKTNSVSKPGSQLDSIADLIFVAARCANISASKRPWSFCTM